MDTKLPAVSYFNPASTLHHALDEYKTVTVREKVVILALTILATIVSLPIAGLGAVAVFRKITAYFALKNEAVKTDEVATPYLSNRVPEPADCVITIPEELKEEKEEKEEGEEKSAPPKQKGYLVTILGSDRVKYWCPRIGLVAGSVLGFYCTNLGVNFGIFFAQSQNAKVLVLDQGAQKLAPFIDTCITCEKTIPINDALDSQLAALVQSNKADFSLLKDVSTNMAQATKSSILSSEGLHTAGQFAKEASHGDVPLNFLSVTNAFGAIGGGYGGYRLGEYIATWLDQ